MTLTETTDATGMPKTGEQVFARVQEHGLIAIQWREPCALASFDDVGWVSVANGKPVTPISWFKET